MIHRLKVLGTTNSLALRGFNTVDRVFFSCVEVSTVNTYAFLIFYKIGVFVIIKRFFEAVDGAISFSINTCQPSDLVG